MMMVLLKPIREYSSKLIGKGEKYGMQDMFNINVMCYIGLIYSLVLQIFSRLIIKSQLEDE